VIEEAEDEAEVSDRSFTLLALGGVGYRVIRDSMRANLARAGGKIIHRLPARDIARVRGGEF